MNQLLATLAPIGLLLGGGPRHAALSDGWGRPIAAILADDRWQQVRIEQHFSIRITPGAPLMPSDMVEALQQEEDRPARLEERDIGKCVSIGGLMGVQSAIGNRLLLFMRDRSVVSAQLDKRCQSRDFYSGFYVERPADGQLCVNRDKLQSRSGANCKIHRLGTLVTAARRFP